MHETSQPRHARFESLFALLTGESLAAQRDRSRSVRLLRTERRAAPEALHARRPSVLVPGFFPQREMR